MRRLDGPGCSAVVRAARAGHPSLANVGVVSPDGRLVCSALPVTGPVDLRDRAFVQRALASRDFAVGDYQIGRVTGKATINAAYPAIEDGQVRAIPFVAIDLAWLNQVIHEAGLPEGSTLTVVDQEGVVLVRHPEHAEWVGRSMREMPHVRTVLARRTGVAEAAGPSGLQELLGFAPLLETATAGNIYITVGIPGEAAVGAARRRFVVNLAVMALVAAGTLGLAWAGSTAMVDRHVRRLVDTARRAASGDLAVRARLDRGPAELATVGQAMDAMLAALERARASEKLTTLGRLAAGIAHELRNPLTVISGRLQLLQRQVAEGNAPSPEGVRRHLPPVEEAVDRMRRIVEAMSAYSRPRTTTMDLRARDVLRHVQSLVAYQARSSGVTVAIDCPEDLPPVRADRSQMVQILLNLATNAIQAMEEAGRPGTLTLRGRVDAEQVVIEVADDGPGIPADRLGAIWDPFYTTKADGTGLGLSIVRSLVEEQPGAAIAVESVEGRGTVFRLALPASR